MPSGAKGRGRGGLLFAAAAVTACDQGLKALLNSADAPLIPGVLRLQGVFNTGAAFGLFQGRAGLLALLSVLALAAGLAWMVKGALPAPSALGLALLLGGAAGNLLDRLLRGGVVDYLVIELFAFPAFNLADMAIVLGAVLTAVPLLFFGKPGRGK